MRSLGVGGVAFDFQLPTYQVNHLPNSHNANKLLVIADTTAYWFSSNCSGGTSRQTFAGAPSTTLRAGTSRVTIDPAATNASSPSVRPGRTVTLAPIRAPRFIVTPL